MLTFVLLVLTWNHPIVITVPTVASTTNTTYVTCDTNVTHKTSVTVVTTVLTVAFTTNTTSVTCDTNVTTITAVTVVPTETEVTSVPRVLLSVKYRVSTIK